MPNLLHMAQVSLLPSTGPLPLHSNLHAGPRWPAGFSVTRPFDAFVFVLAQWSLALPMALSSFGSKEFRVDQSLKECHTILDHSVHMSAHGSSLGCAASNPLDFGRTETVFDSNSTNFQDIYAAGQRPRPDQMCTSKELRATDAMITEIVPIDADNARMFGRIERFDASEVRGPDLSYPIRPIFENIEEMHHDCCYPVMACRLASLMLEKALPFLHSVLVVGDSLPHCTGGVQHFCPEPKASLTTNEQEQTRKMLDELATGVTFTLGLPKCRKYDKYAPYAMTCPSYDVKFSQLPGCGTNIRVNSTMIGDLYRAEESGDVAAYLWHTFLLAKTMVHELAHAAVYSIKTCSFVQESRHVYDKTFVGLSQFSENGYDLENFLFGGLIYESAWKGKPLFFDGNKPTSLQGMITIGDYPNAFRADLYPSCKQRGSPFADIRTDWHVSLSWIHQLLQQSFWDRALKGDNSALHPPRTIGLILGRRGNGKSMKQVELRIEELRAAGVYNVTDFGYISVDPIVIEPKQKDTDTEQKPTGTAASAKRKLKELSKRMFHHPKGWGPLDESW